MTIERIDHVSQGQDRATSYFQNKENFLKLLEIFLNKTQEVEDAFIELANVKDLDTVTGVWLDYVGSFIGEERDGLDDDSYRAKLQLRIAINTSDGTNSSVRNVVRLYTNSDSVRIAEGIYSYGQILFDGESNAAGYLYDTVEDVTPVGSKLLTAQNTNKQCITPAWEVSTVSVDLFYIETGSGQDTLDLVLSPYSEPSSLYVTTDGGEVSVDEDTDSNAVLAWELDDLFLLSSREIFEISLDGVTSEPLYVSGTEGEVEGESLLPWEINEDTYSTDKPWYDYLLPYYNTESNIDEMFTTLQETVDNLPPKTTEI